MKRFKGFAWPYFAWLILFTVLPAVLMILLSFLSSNGMDLSSASFSFASFARLKDPAILKALANSLYVAFMTVILCLLLGYPTAYFLSFGPFRKKKLLLLLLILPMWSNSMLRIVSWLRLFSVPWLAPLHALGSYWAVILVSVATYIPFMIFPIFTVLEKMDRGLLEASRDLGLPAWRGFWKVTLPLSMKGVYSGIIMVFLPASTGFAISEAIGEGRIRLIGNLLEAVFKQNNFNFGSLLSLFVSLVLILLMAIFDRLQEGKKGGKAHA
ncbi:MAG TPA: ABC transporter permease [Firmicutes bacterium]|nr:ABC transporter permease [Bacillota bacterium]